VKRIKAEQAALEEEALRDMRQAAAQRFAEGLGLRVEQLDEAQRAEPDKSCALTEDERDAAHALHPFARYVRGETRYQSQAPDQGPNGPTCARDYLLPDVVPTCFELRRIGWQERARIEEDSDRVTRWCRLVRAGIARITEGEHVIWAATDDQPRMPDDILERLADSVGGYATLIAIAGACAAYSAPITEAEGKL
jgi:hypothetical protein